MNLEVERLLEANEPLRCIGNAVSDLIEESPYIAHLKDAQTGKFIEGNSRWTENLGINTLDDVIGLTVDDLVSKDGVFKSWNFGSAFMTWKENLPKVVKARDDQAKTTQRSIVTDFIGYLSDGSIVFENKITVPIPSQDNRKTIAILTYSQDMSFRRSLSDLLQLYQKHYQEKEAIQHFLMHLNIDGYFNELPTLKELQSLFLIHQGIGLFDAEADSALYKIRDKVDADYYCEMLNRLRAVPVNTH